MGVDVRIHTFFVLLLGFCLLYTNVIHVSSWRGIGLWLLLVLAVAVRETTRVIAAAYYGLKLRNILLLPIGGLYSYARFQSGSGVALLVAANLQPSSNIQGQLRVPPELSAAVKLAQSVDVRMILGRSGAVNTLVGTFTVDALASAGFAISIENQVAQVYSLNASQAQS